MVVAAAVPGREGARDLVFELRKEGEKVGNVSEPAGKV